MLLVDNLFQSNQKVVQGGLLIIHAMICVLEKSIEYFIPQIGPQVVKAIVEEQDENCNRFACGLVSDLSNYLVKNMSNYSDSFMQCLNKVLSDSRYGIETKIHAIIAVGDICLAVEEGFQNYVDETMNCLF